ncbi:putative RNA recognition motif domain, nucleotide-binding alpha-beta plait domain superfamily [Helianthus annuus]|nr:putative RNA recognition motif domain, nucleotide-binding alpha-beta plait domain superfamily [Helianthus annuus]
MDAGGRNEEEGWEFPHVKKKGGSGSRKEERSHVLKFFVTNIPSRCRPWDLANAFRSYGEIGGAFIAKKKDKEGRIFGFVSFKGVRNAAELEDSLQKIKLGDNKLKVNVAMFAKEHGDVAQKVAAGSYRQDRVRSAPASGFVNREHGPKKFMEVHVGSSFADILMNIFSLVLEEDMVDIDPAVFTLTDLFGRAFVGRAKDFNSLRLMNVSMLSAGYDEAEIQYIGGLSVILSFRCQEVAGRFFEDKGSWGSWLQALDTWIGQSLPFKHLAWINIHGFPPPPHLVAQEVFNTIGQKYGKVVRPSQMKKTDGDLTFDRLGIITDCGNRISGCLNLRWQDKIYRVWVVEETDPWIPDFLEDEDEPETASIVKEGWGGSEESVWGEE